MRPENAVESVRQRYQYGFGSLRLTRGDMTTAAPTRTMLPRPFIPRNQGATTIPHIHLAHEHLSHTYARKLAIGTLEIMPT